MTGMPAPRLVETNGIRMSVHEAGAGPAIVFCHGFPELAWSWRHQIGPVAAAGYRAIAPDQRGYGGTDAPAAVEAYDMAHLTGDLVGLLDALGIEKAIFCGHDWGGMVVWQMPLRHPERVAGVIGLNTPFLPRGPIDPIAAMRAVMGEDMYIVHFQKPGVADAELGADAKRSMRFFMRRDTGTAEEWARRPADQKTLALVKAMALPEDQWPGACLLDEAELDHVASVFARTGFTGGINWYRNFTRNWEASANLVEHVAVPCLMIMAENDVVLSPAMADGMERYCPDLEKHLVRGSGHWTQQEKPEEVTRVIIDWLRRRFPTG